MLKSWILLELQSQHSIFLAPCSAAPDWWAKVENKASEGPWQGSRSIKGKSRVPNHPKEVTGFYFQGQTPSGSLEGDNVWRRVRDCRSHSKDGGEPTGPIKIPRSLDQLVQNNHTCSGEPRFALCPASLGEIYSPEPISAQGSSPAPMWERPQAEYSAH